MTFDQRLSWSKHIHNISPTATLIMRILKKLAGSQLGANLKNCKQVHIGNGRPVLEYGSSTFGTAVSTTLKKLDKIKNTGLRIISGGMKSTPINEMESLAGLKSLEEKKGRKDSAPSRKAQAPSTPPYARKMSELSSYRIKR